MSRYIEYPQRKRPTPKPSREGMLISDWRHEYQIQTGRLKLNPVKMANILKRADLGDTQAMYEMFSGLEEDPHIHSVLSRRKLAVTGRTLQITPSVDETAEGETDDPNRERAVDAADLCTELLWGDALNRGIDGWQQALLDIADGIGRGFSLVQVVWEYDTARQLNTPVALSHWPQSSCYLGPQAGEDLPADYIRVAPEGNTSQLIDLEYGAFIRHIHKVRSDIIARAALLRIVSWWYLLKHFSARDWAVFIERYGMPLRLGKYSRTADDEERGVLREAVIGLGKDGGAILPDDTAIEFVEAKLSGSIPHDRFANYCDEQISKAILGQTMTTDAPDRGARSLGEVQQVQQNLIANDDALRIAESIRRDLLAPIVRFNLGERYPVPRCAFVSEEETDTHQLAQRDQILAKMGLPIGVNYLYDMYQIPPPDEDEETVKAAPATSIGPNAPQQEKGDTEQNDGDEESEGGQDNNSEGNATSKALSALADKAAREKKKSLAWAI